MIVANQPCREANPTFSGFEIGLNLKYKARGISQHFRYADWHPVVECCRAYQKIRR